MVRYSVISNKNPREIIMLRGEGCGWRKCTFCDYHLDCSQNEQDNINLNRQVMSKVCGIYHHLEVINSGSFTELPHTTLLDLKDLCEQKQIHTLHFECHWLYREQIFKWREIFKSVGTDLKIKTGVESFDFDFRENFLRKGIAERSPEKIAVGFDECCLLFGLCGQNTQSMIADIETGLKYFERVCVNIFTKNKTKLNPDEAVIAQFLEKVAPLYKDNDRVDILINNTDFGVGADGDE
ncbi:MAG: radical SAM protein [Acutalibacteraceae bacterium]|nr:radical SAM protein [Acutalibacteraceae bacterium]